MKIKTDFVTNSSSTCYVLSSIVTGHLPGLKGSFDLLDKHYEGTHFIYKDYAHVTNNEDDLYTDSRIINFDFMLKNMKHYDDQDREIALTIFELKIDILNPYSGIPIEEEVSKFIEDLLFNKLNQKIKPTQLTYLSWPSSQSGDGWDGGDAQGPSDYYYTHDLYKDETKMGILTIFGSKVIAEIQTIGNPMSVTQTLLDNINEKGLSLEEQNDKNS